MYSVPSSTEILEANSIWNSAGMPEDASIPVYAPPAAETAIPEETQLSNLLSHFQIQTAVVEAVETVSPLSLQSVSTVSPMLSEVSSPASRDPGYYSESECSSNSSDKDAIQHIFALNSQQALRSQAARTTEPPFTTPPGQPRIPPAPTPFDPAINKPAFTRKFDPQSFDAADCFPEADSPDTSSGDESWKCIGPPKKPGTEAAIVPDYSLSYLPRPGDDEGSPTIMTWDDGGSPKIVNLSPSFSKQQVSLYSF